MQKKYVFLINAVPETLNPEKYIYHGFCLQHW